MFDYFTGSVADRWQDVEGLSDKAQLLLESIKVFVPTGNFPSMGFSKWGVALLFNLVGMDMQGEFLRVIKELCEKNIFVAVYTYEGGHYGYYANVEALTAVVIQKEGSLIIQHVSRVLVLPEDDCLKQS